MREELEKALAREFPFMCRREAGGAWKLGVSLDMGNGWYQLIHNMCAEITAVYEAEGRLVDIVVEQAKEKYGTLCFYYRHEGLEHSGGVSLPTCPGDSEIQKKVSVIVDKYEERSAYVCEVCGKPGSSAKGDAESPGNRANTDSVSGRPCAKNTIKNGSR